MKRIEIYRKLRIIVFIMAASAFSLLKNAGAQEKIRIMPLGNSITWGNMCTSGSIYNDCQPLGANSAVAYRGKLMELLTGAGYSIDFIGKQNSGKNYITDTNHSGFGGITADQLAEIMETGRSLSYGYVTANPYMEDYPAEIVLLHIGTNDALRGRSSVAAVERILNAIDAYEARAGKTVTVFVSKIISFRNYPCGTQSVVKDFNYNLGNLVSQRLAQGDNLIPVDMECDAGINYYSHMADEVHPNQTGYDKMGELWFTVLDDYLRSQYFKYQIIADASTGGSISPSGTTVLGEGQSQTYSFSANQGYELTDVRVDGSSVGTPSQYTFSDVEANHNIYAEFALKEYSIQASSEGSGSINPTGNVAVEYGKNQLFTLSPDANHRVSNLLVNGSSVGTPGEYEIRNVTSNQTIHAVFSPITHTITAGANPNGEINPSGNIEVNQGDNQSFTFLPDEDYRVKEVFVDGVSQGAPATYRFTNVQKAHEIEVFFEKQSYTLTTVVSGNGSVSPAGPLTLNPGEDQLFTFTPETYNLVSDVRVNGVSFGAVSEYTLTDIGEDTEVEVIFEQETCNIIAASCEHGSIDPPGLTLAGKGENQLYTIRPDEGYEIQDVLVDGTSVGAVDSFVFENVLGDHIIQAFFSLMKFEIETSVRGDGFITPSGTVTVDYGEDKSFVFTPQSEVDILEILVDDVSIGISSFYTFSEVKENHSISVVFEERDINVGNLQVSTEYAFIQNVYPNPNTGRFMVKMNTDQYSAWEDGEWRIVDIFGRVYIQQKIAGADHNLRTEFDLPGLAPGVYFVEAISDQKREVNRFVVKK